MEYIQLSRVGTRIHCNCSCRVECIYLSRVATRDHVICPCWFYDELIAEYIQLSRVGSRIIASASVDLMVLGCSLYWLGKGSVWIYSWQLRNSDLPLRRHCPSNASCDVFAAYIQLSRVATRIYCICSCWFHNEMIAEYISMSRVATLIHFNCLCGFHNLLTARVTSRSLLPSKVAGFPLFPGKSSKLVTIAMQEWPAGRSC